MTEREDALRKARAIVGGGKAAAWRLMDSSVDGVVTLRGPHGLVVWATAENPAAVAALEWLCAMAREEWPGESTP